MVPGGWVQLFVDDHHAGATVVNLAVQDLDAHIDELQQRGVEPGAIVDANKGVRLSELSDPDGNKVWLIGGFRVQSTATLAGDPFQLCRIADGPGGGLPGPGLVVVMGLVDSRSGGRGRCCRRRL